MHMLIRRRHFTGLDDTAVESLNHHQDDLHLEFDHLPILAAETLIRHSGFQDKYPAVHRGAHEINEIIPRARASGVRATGPTRASFDDNTPESLDSEIIPDGE